MNSVYGLLLAVIAGMSTVLGALLVSFMKNTGNKKISIILGFSAGIMIIVAFFDLLPESSELLFNSLNKFIGSIVIIGSVLVGILIALGIDKLLHHGDKEHELYHVGLITTIAISLHKFPEGIAVFIASYANLTLGITMTIAIGIHHIPEGMAIAAPIYYATGSKLKAIKYALLSSLAEPIGALTAFLVLKPFINDIMLGILFAIAIGIFLFIVIEELIPTSREYGHTKLANTSIIIGMIFMFICQMIFKG
jgi:ZIP family zinc transporter